MLLRSFILYIFLLVSFSLNANTLTTHSVINPEDLAVIEGNHWVLASSMAGGIHHSGAIVAVHTKSGESYQLYPVVEKSKATDNCQGEVSEDHFAPHGITQITDEEGQIQLYVVNHGNRESIELFHLSLSPKPQLHWRDCLVLPEGTYANSVAVTKAGTVFVSNMGESIGDSTSLTLSTEGNILYWQPKIGWLALENSSINGPNGILITEDNHHLYVASWTDSELIELTLNSNEVSRKVIQLPILPDNLSWSDNGNILVAGHQTDAEVVTQCFVSAQNRCTIPSAIAVIAPSTFALKCVVPVTQNMATVAVHVGEQTWIGTARGDSIYSLPTKTLFPNHCQ